MKSICDGLGYQFYTTNLHNQARVGDLQGVKETIDLFFNDTKYRLLLFHGHWVREIALGFARAGDVPGAIEIAKKHGDGILCLALIVLAQAGRGDLVGAKETAFLVEDETMRATILDCVNELQLEGKSSEESSQL